MKLQEILARNDTNSQGGVFGYNKIAKAISSPSIDYSEVWSIFVELPPDAQEAIATAGSYFDDNLFVSLLQGTMVTSGSLVGPIDGLIGPKTLAAFRVFCPSELDQVLCEGGPLNRSTRQALVGYFVDLRESERQSQ